jgi:hypothetical protein
MGICFGFMASTLLSTFSVSSHKVRRIEQTQNCIQQPPTKATTSNADPATGWNTIHVFYGNTTHLNQVTQLPAVSLINKKWFSQVQQDEMVSRLLRGKRNGFFVDLASNDAVRISNTYALETHHNWKGLCLEANSVYWAGLAYRPGCTAIAAVVGKEMMEEVSFRFPNRAAPKGGIVDRRFDNTVQSAFGEDQLRYTVTLAHILEYFHAPSVMDYLSLDVEGAESFVMSTFPFDRYRFNLLTIERPDDELCRLLDRNGYKLLKKLRSWGETIWAHEAVTADLDLSALDMDTEHYAYRDI